MLFFSRDPDLSSWRRIAASVGFGVSLPVFLYTTCHLILNARRKRKILELSKVVPSTGWDYRTVCKWLSTRGVSEDAIILLARQGLDGNRIPHLTPQELIEMGLNAEDRKIVLSSLSEVEGVEQPRKAPKALEAREIESQEEIPATASAPPSFPLNNFLSNADRVIMQVMFPCPGDGKTDVLNHRAKLCAQLYKLFDHFHSLSSVEQRGVMVALAGQFDNALASPTIHSSAASEPPFHAERVVPLASAADTPIHLSNELPTSSPDLTTREEEILQNFIERIPLLDGMLDRFMEILGSSHLQSVPPERLPLLTKRIADQVMGFLRVLDVLPSALQKPLRLKCSKVLEMIDKVSANVSDADATSATELTDRTTNVARVADQKADEIDQISLQSARLGTLLQRISHPSLLKLEPSEKRKSIKEFLTELQAIDSYMQRTNDERAVAGRKMCAEIFDILQELYKITEGEDRLPMTNPVQSMSSTKLASPSIQNSLEDILKMVTSVESVNLPQDVKRKASIEMQEKLVKLLERAGDLPDGERDKVMSYMRRIFSLMPTADEDLVSKTQEVGAQNERADNNEGKEEANQKEQVKEDWGLDDEPAQGATASESKLVVDLLKQKIESHLCFLNSERFTNFNPDEKLRLAEKIHEDVKQYTQMLSNAGCSEQFIMQLIAPIQSVLMQHLQLSKASQQSIEINNTLADVQAALSSSTFQNQSQLEKINFARVFLPQLEHIRASLPMFSIPERAVAEKLLEPIHQNLMMIVSAGATDDAPDPSVRDEADEKKDTGSLTASEGLQSLIKRMNVVMKIIQSKEFTEAQEQERARMVTSCIAELKAIQEDCSKLPPESRQPLSSIVSQLLEQLKKLAQRLTFSRTRSPTKTEREPQSTLDGDREIFFGRMAQITEELRKKNNQQIRFSDPELKTFWRLSEIADKLPNLSPAETRLRYEFETQLQLASQQPSSEGAAAEESSALNPPPQHPQESATLKDAEQELTENNGDESIEDLQSFIAVFKFIRDSLKESDNIALDQLVALSTLVETALDAAIQHGIVWEESEEALEAVKAVQEGLEKMKNLATKSDDDILAIIEEATRELGEHPPKSEEQLVPYVDLYERFAPLLVSIPELEAVLNLLKGQILDACSNLKSHNREEISDQNDRLSNALFELSYRLREPDLSKEELYECETLLDRLSSANVDNSDFQEALTAVREQIKLKRQVFGIDNEVTSEEEVKEDAQKGEQSSEQKKPEVPKERHCDAARSRSAFKKDDGESNANQEPFQPTEQSAEVIPYDGVPGGLENELMLLPKIEMCIEKPTEQFVATCNLFDIQSISKVLLHLSGFDEVEKNSELRNRVNATKIKFLSKLQAFKESEAPSQEVQASAKLQVTVENTPTDAGGIESYKFIVFMLDESENYSANVAGMELLQKTENAVSTAVKDDIVHKWVGRSKAIILLAWEGVKREEEDTSLSELVLLHEVLTKRYGFDTVCVVGPKQSATAVECLLKSMVESECPSRLLLFYYTPHTGNVVNVPHSMVFHDCSVLEHSKVVKLTAPVERVVVVHSMPRKLEVMARMGEKVSPAMSVFVTSAAAKEVAKVRCLLYNGLFTPIIIELLCRDEGTMLCPEDLINYTITAMTRLTIEFGSFLNSEAASMGYFVPFDK